jgi:nucleoside phosphorylase
MFHGKNERVALFTANKMGMPYTAARLMEVITQINPRVTFFIGTCAGLNGQKLGSVVVPNRAFSYESGRYWCRNAVNIKTFYTLGKGGNTYLG